MIGQKGTFNRTADRTRNKKKKKKGPNKTYEKDKKNGIGQIIIEDLCRKDINVKDKKTCMLMPDLKKIISV